jgi:hypothetical protein
MINVQNILLCHGAMYFGKMTKKENMLLKILHKHTHARPLGDIHNKGKEKNTKLEIKDVIFIEITKYLQMEIMELVPLVLLAITSYLSSCKCDTMNLNLNVNANVNGSSTDVEENSMKILSRKRRFLVFPEGSSFSVCTVKEWNER